MIDLHTHSTASDGSHSPEEVVALAVAAGVRCLALTDHDTIAGIDQASGAAARRGLGFIPGIEISVSWDNRSWHIVGLGIDPANEQLGAVVRQAAQTRIHRARAMSESLAAAGIPGAFRGACDIAGGESNLTRSHFARFLVDQGLARDNRQVFKRFLVKGRPGYAASEWLPMVDAVNVIHAAGGVAVMAHPARYNVTTRRLRRVLADFRKAGGDAMEVSCGGGHAREVLQLAKLANEFGLAASAGSDYHGPDKPWARLGRLPSLPGWASPVSDLLPRT